MSVWKPDTTLSTVDTSGLSPLIVWKQSFCFVASSSAIACIDINSTGFDKAVVGRASAPEEDPTLRIHVVDGADDESAFVVVSAHRSGLLRLWNGPGLVLGECLNSHHKDPITLMGSGHGGIRELLTVSLGGVILIKLWDLEKRTCNKTLRTIKRPPTCITPLDDQSFCIGCADGELYRWSADGECAELEDNPHKSAISSIVAIKDQLVTAERAQILVIWSKDRRPLKQVLTMEEITVLRTVSFPSDWNLGDSELLLSGGSSGRLRLWNVTSGKEVRSGLDLWAVKGVGISDVHVSADKIAFVQEDVVFTRSLDAASEGLSAALCLHTDPIIESTLVAGKTLVYTSGTGLMKLHRLEDSSLKVIWSDRLSPVLLLSACAAGSPTFVSSGEDHVVTVWQLTDEGASRTVSCRGHSERIKAACLFQGVLLSADSDGVLKMWLLPQEGQAETDSCESAGTIRAHQKQVTSIAFSTKLGVIVTTSQDKSAKVWNVKTQALHGTLTGHKGGLTHASISPDEKLVATASTDKTLRLWNLKHLNCVATLEGSVSATIRCMFVSASEIACATANGALHFWSKKEQKEYKLLCPEENEGHTDTATGLFLWNESCVTTGSDGKIILWRDISDRLREQKDEEKRILQSQKQSLENSMRSGNTLQSLVLALRLRRAPLVYDLLRTCLEKGDLERIVTALPKKSVWRLIELLPQWNAHSRHYAVAAAVQRVLMTTSVNAFGITEEKMMQLQTYNVKHWARLSALESRIALIDMLLFKME